MKKVILMVIIAIAAVGCSTDDSSTETGCNCYTGIETVYNGYQLKTKMQNDCDPNTFIYVQGNVVGSTICQ